MEAKDLQTIVEETKAEAAKRVTTYGTPSAEQGYNQEGKGYARIKQCGSPWCATCTSE